MLSTNFHAYADSVGAKKEDTEYCTQIILSPKPKVACRKVITGRLQHYQYNSNIPGLRYTAKAKIRSCRQTRFSSGSRMKGYGNWRFLHVQGPPVTEKIFTSAVAIDSFAKTPKACVRRPAYHYRHSNKPCAGPTPRRMCSFGFGPDCASRRATTLWNSRPSYHLQRSNILQVPKA